MTSPLRRWEREIASSEAALCLLNYMETVSKKLVIWELFVYKQGFPRGHVRGEIQFWTEGEIKFHFFVKIIPREVSDVNGHFAILDKVVVFSCFPL